MIPSHFMPYAVDCIADLPAALALGVGAPAKDPAQIWLDPADYAGLRKRDREGCSDCGGETTIGRIRNDPAAAEAFLRG